MAKAKKQASEPRVDIGHYDVIVAPHITEKSTLLSEHNAVVTTTTSDGAIASDWFHRRSASIARTGASGACGTPMCFAGPGRGRFCSASVPAQPRISIWRRRNGRKLFSP